MTYFQPVLDKLNVVPSRLDIMKPSVLVEGKGDYLILEYGRKIACPSTSKFAIVPTRGATGLDELVGLFLGWAVPFVICLDDDKAGKSAQSDYISGWGISTSRVLTLGQVNPALKGKSIEGFLDPLDVETIRRHFSLSKNPTKSQIQLFFSEMLASGTKVAMSKHFCECVNTFDEHISSAIESLKLES